MNTRANKTGHHAIPCALCSTTPALRECGVQVTALGLENITVYLCQHDYNHLYESQQSNQAKDDDQEKERARFRQIRQDVVTISFHLYGQQWPLRLDLWKEHEETEKQYRQSRVIYQQADDTTSDGHNARLHTLRLAGICLAQAICIEAIGKQEGTEDSAVSGTMVRVTTSFSKGGHTLREKTISRQHVIDAMLAILHYRENHPTNEEGELAVIDRTFQDM